MKPQIRLAYKMYTSITSETQKCYLEYTTSICEERNRTNCMIKNIYHQSFSQSVNAFFKMKEFLLLRTERYFAHMSL